MDRAQRERIAGTTLGISHPAPHDLARTLLRGRVRGTVLDLGTGTGTSATWLAEQPGVERVLALDVVRYAGFPAHPRITWQGADLNEPLPVADASVDAIVAIEVVSALEHPRDVFRDWTRALRPGGVAVVTMPNVESWRSLLGKTLRGHFPAYHPAWVPANISALTRRQALDALATAGFTAPEFVYAGWGYLPGLSGRGLGWQSLLGPRAAGRRISDNWGCRVTRP